MGGLVLAAVFACGYLARLFHSRCVAAAARLRAARAVAAPVAGARAERLAVARRRL